MQYAGGILLEPVQTLVPTIIFVADENADKSLLLRNKKQPIYFDGLLLMLI